MPDDWIIRAPDGTEYECCPYAEETDCHNCPVQTDNCRDGAREITIRPKRKQVEPEDVQGYDGADEMFKLRRDTQRVTGGLERDVALLQENQRNVARVLIPLEKTVGEVEIRLGKRIEDIHWRVHDLEKKTKALDNNWQTNKKRIDDLEQRVVHNDERIGKNAMACIDLENELKAIREWLGRESDLLKHISTQIHRAIDRMVLVEGDGDAKLIIRLEDARK